MPDEPTIYDFPFMQEDDAQAQARAMAQALRRQQMQGLAVQALTGGQRAGPMVGQGLTHQAGVEQGLGAKLLEDRMKYQLGMKELAQRQAQAAGGEERWRAELGARDKRTQALEKAMGLKVQAVIGPDGQPQLMYIPTRPGGKVSPVVGPTGEPLKPAPSTAPTPGKTAADLRKEFQAMPVVKKTQEVAEANAKIQSTTPTGAGDISMLVAYMKMVDPGSTVRENEFATAANAGGVEQRVRNIYNNVRQGHIMTPEVREQFRAESKNILNAQMQNFNATAAQYKRLAEQSGAKAEDVILELGYPGQAQTGASKTGLRKKYGLGE